VGEDLEPPRARHDHIENRQVDSTVSALELFVSMAETDLGGGRIGVMVPRLIAMASGFVILAGLIAGPTIGRHMSRGNDSATRGAANDPHAPQPASADRHGDFELYAPSRTLAPAPAPARHRSATTTSQQKSTPVSTDAAQARFVILMVCDGWGPLHIEATNQHSGTTPSYQLNSEWIQLWMSTFPADGEYDGAAAWSDFTYPLQGATDSAAAATAMYTGLKTQNGRITVDAEGTTRLENVAERARRRSMAVGAVTTVPVSHATPGALTSHNLARSNTYAIADELFFGDPNSTGTVVVDPRYGGGFGSTFPVTDVVIGDRSTSYLHTGQRDRLLADSGMPGRHVLVEGVSDIDGGAALLDAAADPTTRMLVGLFDRVNLRATAVGGGYRLETPSLTQSTAAALTVLSRRDAGFLLLVEGGAVDWAAHANDMDRVIGELLDFDDAVGRVVDWVEDPDNGSGWYNTLVVVTGDHETGYLTGAHGVFPDQSLAPGSVNERTLDLEKVELSSGRRASWVDDSPPNDTIDPGETVYWTWNSGGHSNTLIPFYARGVASAVFTQLAISIDPVRGPYIDNTDVFAVADQVVDQVTAIFGDGFESGTSRDWTREVP